MRSDGGRLWNPGREIWTWTSIHKKEKNGFVLFLVFVLFFTIIKYFGSVDWSFPCLLKLALWFPTAQLMLHYPWYTTIYHFCEDNVSTHVCTGLRAPSACQTITFTSSSPIPHHRSTLQTLTVHPRHAPAKNLKMTWSMPSRNSESDVGRSQ